MNKKKKIYFDTCCLCRPFDAHSLSRTILEADAVKLLLEECYEGKYVFVKSDVLQLEINQINDEEKRFSVEEILMYAHETIITNPETSQYIQKAAQNGLNGYDAIHIALALQYKIDVLLTTDHLFLKRAKSLPIRVINPLEFFLEENNNEK
ncbi:MAG: PIN domain-containing protein [Ignavibacteriae bacterium]|nr:PIN domain-containing protein [Ignavibacteriota bacterium]